MPASSSHSLYVCHSLGLPCSALDVVPDTSDFDYIMCLALACCHTPQIFSATLQVVDQTVEDTVDARSLPHELNNIMLLALSQVQMICCLFWLG